MVSVVVVSVDVRRGRRSGPDDEVRDVFSVVGMLTAFLQSGVCLRYGWAGAGFSGLPFAARDFRPFVAGCGYTEAYRRTSQM